MAAIGIIVLLVSLAVYNNAAPVSEPTGESETTTADGVQLVEYIEVIDIVPEVVALIPETTDAATEQSTHEVAKRSVLGNPNNGFVSNFEAANEESGLVGRIKVLPSWVRISAKITQKTGVNGRRLSLKHQVTASSLATFLHKKSLYCRCSCGFKRLRPESSQQWVQCTLSWRSEEGSC
ncbi:unnamed protein product, partial [Iphiclides podalirius]